MPPPSSTSARSADRRDLLEHLSTNAPPKNREEEAAKARARAELRYARG
jgi:hypothetical protein